MKNVYERPWYVGQQWAVPDAWDLACTADCLHQEQDGEPRVKHVLLVAGEPGADDVEVLANLTHLRTNSTERGGVGGIFAAEYICKLHNAELARKQDAQSE